MPTNSRRGVTLIEMVVTLVILGVLLSVAAPAIARRPAARGVKATAESLDSLNRVAAATHRMHQITIRGAGVTSAYVALPDGRIIRSTRVAGDAR